MCAQLPKSPSAQIFLDGILQDAKLDPLCAAKSTCGGTLMVNNVKVVVPSNLMVIFPANALTWQEIFNGGTTTGLALSDPPTVHGATYIVSVTANRVGNEIRAALIDITQDTASIGSGAPALHMIKSTDPCHLLLCHLLHVPPFALVAVVAGEA